MIKTYSIKLIVSLLLITGLLSGTINADTSDQIDQLKNAEMFYELGYIKGNDYGVDSNYLASTATRLQASLITIRLFGREEDMLNFDIKGKLNFSDISVTDRYERTFMAFLYANKSLGWVGNSNKQFRPHSPVTSKELTKVLLEYLGYKYGIDFDWSNVLEFSHSLGMTGYNADHTSELTIAQVIDIITEALTVKMKNDRLFIEDLIQKDLIPRDLAVSYNLVREELNIEYIDILSRHQLKIYFNIPIDYLVIRHFYVPGIYIKGLEIKNDGTMVLLDIIGLQEGKPYDITINGAEYLDVVQNKVNYTIKY